MTKRSIAFVVAVLAVSSGVRVIARADGEVCAPSAKQQAAVLEREIGELFRQGRYADAAEKCLEEIAVVPESSAPQYNLACALARLGKTEEALAALSKAVALGFDDPGHLSTDDDLASLRGEKAFEGLVAKAADNDRKAEAGTYDPGITIPGVTAIDRSPEGGLRYRLLVPDDATAEKPSRLLVWLHPSGGSMNDTIEAYSPPWLKLGWAVLVPTQKRWRGWSDADATKLLEKSLPDAGTLAGIDAKKPLLFGFSAGGQMAIELWSRDASRFGGLAIDAAYPVDRDASARGERKVLRLPAGDAVRSVPIFVLVGLEDAGHAVWKDVEGPWSEAGVPLTVKYVEEGRHEWLLRAGLTLDFAKWLEEVKAGKMPGARTPPVPPAPEK